MVETIPTRKASPYLLHAPRIHRYWWTVMPALPSSRNTRAYFALRRLWADQTDPWRHRSSIDEPLRVPTFFVSYDQIWCMS